MAEEAKEEAQCLFLQANRVRFDEQDVRGARIVISLTRVCSKEMSIDREGRIHDDFRP